MDCVSKDGHSTDAKFIWKSRGIDDTRLEILFSRIPPYRLNSHNQDDTNARGIKCQ